LHEFGVGGRALGLPADQHDLLQERVVLQNRRDGFPQGGRDEEDAGLRIAQNRVIDIRRQQRVQRDRDHAGFQRTKEQLGKFDLVQHQKGGTLACPHAPSGQRARDMCGPLGQTVKGQGATALCLDIGHVRAAPFFQMAIHEIGGGIGGG